MMPVIETVVLNQRYGELEVLRNINLRVEKGDVFALIGPSGAGKTTLLRLIDLLEVPSSGRIYLDGTDVTALRQKRLALRRRIAFVLQKPLVFNMSVYDNIACGLRWRGRSQTEIREKVTRLLELVKLSDLKDKNARTLSGGEAQRVAIARAVVLEPEVLLLDEPMANLDPVSILKTEGLIRDIFHQYQTTIVMATHDLSQGRRLASRIAVMVNGEIIQEGKPDDVFSSPTNREVAEFVGVDNIVGGVITARDGEIAVIDLGGKVIEAISDYAVGEEVYACIRPEDVTIALSRPVSSARNSILGEITRVVLSGSLVHVEVDCGFPLVALLTKKSTEELNLKRGGQVYASFKATAIHIIKRQ
ncbi:ABC transporter ATP-binding protein [Chloroflexota bacterium]